MGYPFDGSSLPAQRAGDLVAIPGAANPLQYVDAALVNRMLTVLGELGQGLQQAPWLGVLGGTPDLSGAGKGRLAYTGGKLQWSQEGGSYAPVAMLSQVTAADFLGLANMLGNLPSLAPSGGARVYAADGRIWTSESGGRARVLTREDGVFNIRDYGAKPGSANKAATTAAFLEIFEEISWGYYPTVNGRRNAIIHVPMVETGDAWYVNALTGYVGNPGAALNIIGDVPTGRGGIGGSVLYYDGPTGGTLLDLQALNASTIRNITFHGNRKAKKLLHLRQHWNAVEEAQVGSSGINVIDCQFMEPENEYDSVLVAAGNDDNPPDTFQSSEYRFFRCFFQGVDAGPGLTKSGWGFKALNAGNTKNFIFENCAFGQLYRGIESGSGFLIVKDCNGGNIGQDRGDAAMIWASANALLILGGGMENGNIGHAAKFLHAGQGTPLFMASVYVAGTTEGDDVMVDLGGPSKIVSCDIGGNSRTSEKNIAWAGSTAVLAGQERKNGGKLYRCITPGTTAASGGPTGTASDITDGTAHWRWVTSNLTGNECRIVTGSQETSGWGGLDIELCAFPYTVTPLTGVPVYDGSGNPLWGAHGPSNTDFVKGTSHKVSAKGCSTGVYGGNIDQQLPDFRSSEEIGTREQLWNNSIAAGLTVQRNANGVYIVTVPAAVIAAAGVGSVTICHMPPTSKRFKIVDAILDVTTAFSGSGVSGITAKLGSDLGAVDGLLLDAAIDATGTHGLALAERGTDMSSGRYLPWTGAQANIKLKVSASGGSVAGITAGSLTIYLETKRLGP